MNIDQNAVAQARAVLDAHLTALNARDEGALAATLHFPHYRLSEGVVKIWESKDSYFTDFRKRAGSKWGHTEWGQITPVQASSDKAHLIVEIIRFDKAGIEIARFESLWVIAEVKGRWAAQVRSSFAADRKNAAG